MSLVDSAPVFKARCLSIGLAETVIDSLHDKGWDTHATFAFSCSYIPGSGDDAAFVTKVIEPLLGSADHADGAKLRRLHFESYTLAAAEMKRKVESAEGQPPAKLPPTEVAERIAVLQAKPLAHRKHHGAKPRPHQLCFPGRRRWQVEIY